MNDTSDIGTIKNLLNQIQSIQNEIEKTQDGITNKMIEIKNLQEQIPPLTNLHIRLNQQLQVEYNFFSSNMSQIKKKTGRSISEIHKMYKYRYDKNKSLEKEMKIELGLLSEYIDSKFQGVEKIQDIKKQIRSVLIEIVKLQQIISIKSHELQVLQIQIIELEKSKKNLEEQLKIKQAEQEEILRQKEILKKEEEMKQIENENNKEQIGGKKRKIRKHKGINQQTGRLKKGYKYTGKRLKSGLSEIKKLKKRRK